MELVTKSKQIKKVLVKQFQIEKKSIFLPDMSAEMTNITIKTVIL